MAYMALDDHVAALRDAQAAVASAPGWPKAHFRHAKVLTVRGSFMEAYGAFKQAWHLDTQNKELVLACQQAHQLMIANDQIRAQLHAKKVATARQAASPAWPCEAEVPRGLSVEPVGDAESLARGLSLTELELGSSSSSGTAAPTGQSSLSEEGAESEVRADAGNVDAEGTERAGSSAGSAESEVADVVASDKAGGEVVTADGEAAKGGGVPEYELSREERESKLVVWLPLVEAMAGVELSLSSTQVVIFAAGAYAPLEVQLPFEVDDAAGKARFDKKARKLTVRLPHKGVLV
uniref:PIH1D1/2/3 CS-like domain-containing protein n=1 Tax=Haptolina ericina TaxID=156174 RepID=A0A7S3ANY9_9EUKA